MEYENLVYVNFYTPIFILINFGILFFILKKFLYKPVKKILDERKNEVEKMYDDAQQNKQEAMKLKEEYEMAVRESKEQAGEIIKQATVKAEEKSDEIIRESNKKAQHIINKAYAQIEQEKKQAVNELKNSVGDLAIEAARAVVEKELSNDEHDRLINDFIANIGDEAWNK